MKRTPKPCCCKICGDTDPMNFRKSSKSMCATCSYIKHYYKVNTKEEILAIISARNQIKMPKPYFCENCGETNPMNFRKGVKNKCKTCLSVKINGKAKKRESKPYHCLTCGETEPSKFYEKRRIKCRVCLNEKARLKRRKSKPPKFNINTIKRRVVQRKKIINNLIKTGHKHKSEIIKPVPKKVHNYTQDEYIQKVREFNGDRYTFEKTVYVNRDTDIVVTCAKHKVDIVRKAYVFIRNVHGNLPQISCCPECRMEHKRKKIKTPKPPKVSKPRQTLFVYINKKKHYPCEIHGNVLVGKNRVFGDGCPSCNIERTQKNFASYDEAKARVNRLGINSHSEYRQWKKRTCQDDLPSNPESVYRNKGWVDYYEFFGNDKRNMMSNGERRIYDYLIRKNIEHVWQKKFDDCKNIHRLPFDFYIPDYNVAIEFDGEQHFKPSNFSKSDEENHRKFLQIQKNDGIKTQYCQDNGIKLLRFDVYHVDNNILEWELDNELIRIAAEIAVKHVSRY